MTDRPTRPASSYDLAGALAAEVDRVDGVVRRHSGARGEVATYGEAGKVDGVRIEMGAGRLSCVRVDLVVRLGVSVPAVADEVRGAVRDAVVRGRVEHDQPLAVDVHVRDVELVEPGSPPT